MSTDDIQPLCLAGQFEEPDPNERSEVTIIGYQVTDSKYIQYHTS